MKLYDDEQEDLNGVALRGFAIGFLPVVLFWLAILMFIKWAVS